MKAAHALSEAAHAVNPPGSKQSNEALPASGEKSGVRSPSHALERMKLFKRSCAARLGTLIGIRSMGEAGNTYLIKVRCSRTHEFEISGKNLLRGVWCAECSAIEADLLKAAELLIAKAHAEAQGGECMSTVYASARSLLDWKCHLGHEWSARWDNVKNKGSWCPNCARSRPRPGRRKGR